MDRLALAEKKRVLFPGGLFRLEPLQAASLRAGGITDFQRIDVSRQRNAQRTA